MNREITTKKVGRQKKLTNPCPVIKGEVQIMVGSPKCITCQGFERKIREGWKSLRTLELIIIPKRIR
jgi:hypothetical protein